MERVILRFNRDDEPGAAEDPKITCDAAAQTRLTLDAAGIGTWTWDVGSGAVRWSTAQERIYGLAAGSFPGTYDAFTAPIHPDDRERVLAAIAEGLDRLTEGHLAYRVVRPDGTVRWLDQFSRVLLDPDGRARGVSGVTIDVTGRRGADGEPPARPRVPPGRLWRRG